MHQALGSVLGSLETRYSGVSVIPARRMDAGGSEVQGAIGAQDSLGSMRPAWAKGVEMKKENRRERKGGKEDQWENRMK